MSVVSALRLSRRPALAFVCVGLFWGSFAAQVPVLKAGLGVSDALFGWLLLGTSMGLLPTMWLAPWFDRRLGARAMQLAALIFAGAALLPALAAVPLAFMVAMMAAGLASGLLDVTMNARVSELEARHGRSLMNANHGMFSVAYACSALVTGLAREALWPPMAIFGMMALLIAALAATLYMAPEPVPEEDAAPGAFPWPIVGLCGGIVFVAFCVEATVEQWSALHLERTLGGGAAEGALGPAILGLTMAVGRFSSQSISDLFGERVIIWAGAAMASLGAVIVAVAPVPLVAYFGFGLIGLGIAGVGPVGLAMVGRMVSARQRTAAVARAAVIGFMGFVLAPTMMGLMSQAFGLGPAFLAVALLAMAAPALSLVIEARGRRDARLS